MNNVKANATKAPHLNASAAQCRRIIPVVDVLARQHQDPDDPVDNAVLHVSKLLNTRDECLTRDADVPVLRQTETPRAQPPE